MRTSTAALAVGASVAAILLYRKFCAKSHIKVSTHEDSSELGKAAAAFVANKINATVVAKGHARVIVATGASQFEFIAELVKLSVPWDKVTCFHLDEYCGLPETHGASFRKYLRERLFSKLTPQPAKVHYLDPATVKAYDELLAADDIDLACIGIGENGHVAFNDPPPGGADFADPVLVKKVALDDACRRQQLGEGWFKTLADVPTHAITLTVPAIMRARTISCVVPDERKAQAVRDTMASAISTACPATILRTHSDCMLWLDKPWQRLARGRIKLITIAAEAEGADRLCAHAVRMGVRVSLGHMMAVGDEIGRLAAAGATHLTHLGNGCPNEVHRHKNHLWPCLADDRLCAMIITDGQHLPADTISAILRCKGVHNTIVTSDVAPVAGLDEGSYECFGSFVHVQGKFVRSADKSCLAGSGALMLDCLNHLASLGLRPAPGRDESLYLDELLMLAFDNPIRALGLEPTAVAADLHSLGPSRVLHEAGRFRLVGKVYCDPCAAAAPG